MLVGALLTALLAASTDVRATRSPSRPASNADALLAAWRRYRSGTWVLVSRFERRTEVGGLLRVELRSAQRPPDRLLVGLGVVEARRGGRRLACASGAAGKLICRDGGAAPPFAQEVEVEVATLRTSVVGDPPVYRVDRTSPGCFALVLQRPLAAPSFGLRARLCFDARTGALATSDVTKRGGTDRQVAIEVRATVSDADLAPPVS